MTDLVSWLRPLVEARKTAAEAAHQANPAPWTADIGNLWGTALILDAAGNGLWDDEGSEILDMKGAVGIHAALNDPRQIIADCESDLAVLAEHSPVKVKPGALRCGRCLRWCDHLTELRGAHPDYGLVGVAAPMSYPCRTIRLLAWRYRHMDPAGYAEVAGDWPP